MEPMTINLEGLGPFVYIVPPAMLTLFFVLLGWRNAVLAGRCFEAKSSDKGGSHIAVAVTSAIFALGNMIFLMHLVYEAFIKSLNG